MTLLDLQGMETPEVSSGRLGLDSSGCSDDGSTISLLLCG
ncbi:MAG: SapB/AmfS family lanthipeptide [Pseudonocardiaceae bacterium]